MRVCKTTAVSSLSFLDKSILITDHRRVKIWNPVLDLKLVHGSIHYGPFWGQKSDLRRGVVRRLETRLNTRGIIQPIPWAMGRQRGLLTKGMTRAGREWNYVHSIEVYTVVAFFKPRDLIFFMVCNKIDPFLLKVVKCVSIDLYDCLYLSSFYLL